MRRSDLLRTPILCDGAVEDAERVLRLSGERGAQADAARAHLADVRRRWDREAPARRVRAELAERGLQQAHDDYQAWLWRDGVGWRRRLDPEAALQAAGLPDDDVDDVADEPDPTLLVSSTSVEGLPPPSPASARYRAVARRLRAAIRASSSPRRSADRFALSRELEEARASFGVALPASHSRLALVERLLELEGVVLELLASAHPHPVQHPAMTDAWNRAREALSRELAPPLPEVSTLTLVVPETGTWMDEQGSVAATGVYLPEPGDAAEGGAGLLSLVQAWVRQASVVDADVCAVDPRQPEEVAAQFIVRGGRVVGYA